MLLWRNKKEVLINYTHKQEGEKEKKEKRGGGRLKKNIKKKRCICE
jgi:hypothetical protein